MARNLYRVTFGIKRGGHLNPKIETITSVLIETPDPYVGTDLQVKIFENQSFKIFKVENNCTSESEVQYITAEKIPDVSATANMKAHIVIESAHWI